MKKAEIAIAKFKEGFNCAQSVIYSFADEVNINKNQALRISNGFGGGMGRKQEVCGAVSGAIMVIGLKYGRGENDGREKQEITYTRIQELIDSFTKECGTINCRKLLSGCELLTKEGQQHFKENNLINKCYECVRVSCDILEKIL
jgi:C_GCAxxG_C_C family probable redox protein